MKPGGMALLWAAAAMLIAGGCAVGPDYVRPGVEMPGAYKEEVGADGWKLAQPAAQVDIGPWWEVFDDPQLSSLAVQVEVSNQNVQAAEAQYRHALAEINAARATYFPSVSGTASAERSEQSKVRTSQGTVGPITGTASTFNLYSLSLGMSWEADVWGRLRRTTESSVAGAQASAADLAAARLSAQVQLAASYFQLRQLDAQRDLLDRTLVAYRKALELTNNRYAGGIATRADVSQAETLLKTTQVQAIDVGLQRAQLEHAIAILIGKPPSTFSIPATPLADVTPPVPGLGVPSQLLERRPDVAAAERRMAAANAQIGVATAAYFPALTLSGAAGYASTSLEHLLTVPNFFWSVGPALAAVLFDGGARGAQVQQARASYDQSVAQYRQTVLAGMQQVEDNLAQLRILEQEALAQDDALKSARETLTVLTNQYKAGTATYLAVIVAQTAALGNERNAIAILGNRMTASVQLIGAIGGGWSDQSP